MLFDSYMTKAREKEARDWARNNQAKIRTRLMMPTIRSNWFDYYDGWRGIPSDAYLIDVFFDGKKSAVHGPYKTFHIRVSWGRNRLRSRHMESSIWLQNDQQERAARRTCVCSPERGLHSSLALAAIYSSTLADRDA